MCSQQPGTGSHSYASLSLIIMSPGWMSNLVGCQNLVIMSAKQVGELHALAISSVRTWRQGTMSV